MASSKHQYHHKLEDDVSGIANRIIAQMEEKAELREALGVLLRSCVEIFEGDRGCILIIDDHKLVKNGDTTKAEVSLVSFENHNWNLKNEGTMEKFAALCRVTVRDFDYFYFPVLETENIYENFYQEPVKSVMVSGIFIDNLLLGSVTVASQKEDAFSEDRLKLLRTICNRVAPHIILFRQHTADHMANELNQFLNDLDVRNEEFLTSFTNKVVDVLKCEACNLYLYLAEYDLYMLKACTPPVEHTQSESAFHLSDGPGRNGFVQFAAQQRQPLRLNHPRQFRRFLEKHRVTDTDPDDSEFPYRQFMGIPVILEGECIGIIEAMQNRQNKTFTIDDQKLLKNVSFSLSRAIMCLKLYQDAQKRIRELGG